MKTARQRVSATKSGNGLQKTLQTISIWRWLLFILFFYFSVVLVVIREKSPQLWDFPRQPARQRDSNRGCNELSFSEWKLHLFCDLHKTIHCFFRQVAGTVKGQEFKSIGSAAKHALTGAVCRVGFIGYLVNLFLPA